MRKIITLVCSTILIASVSPAFTAEINSSLPAYTPEILNFRQVMPPSVPDALSNDHVNGHVLLQFRLDENGKAQDAKVVLAQPKGAFEKNALYLVSKMRFSLPAEWIARQPDRILEYAIVYLHDSCPVSDQFPGIRTTVIYHFSANTGRDADKMMDACKQKRALIESGNQPSQQVLPAAGSKQSGD
ncbi:MAG: TonB family protein [Gammaproteobacteria bacterium]